MRKLGSLEVSAVGFGAMGFSHGYGPGPSDDEAIVGYRQIDTAQQHGNELRVGSCYAQTRSCARARCRFPSAKGSRSAVAA